MLWNGKPVKIVLYAPILCGIGEYAITEPFHHNTWKHAADVFLRTGDGVFDDEITEPVVRELWCPSCWHYDRLSSQFAAGGSAHALSDHIETGAFRLSNVLYIGCFSYDKATLHRLLNIPEKGKARNFPAVRWI